MMPVSLMMYWHRIYSAFLHCKIVQFVINTSTRLNECLQECIFHTSVYSFFTARTTLDTWHNMFLKEKGAVMFLTKTKYVLEKRYFD